MPGAPAAPLPAELRRLGAVLRHLDPREAPTRPDVEAATAGAGAARASLRSTGVLAAGEASAPHMRSCFFPSIVELEPGKLVATMTAGQEMGSPDTRCYCLRSGDGGASWGPPEKLWEPDQSVRRYSTGIRMSRAHDGTLIGFVNQLNFGSIDEPPSRTTNEVTGGSVPKEHGVVRSIDGTSWSEPEFFDPPMDWACFGEPSPILALSPDRVRSGHFLGLTACRLSLTRAVSPSQWLLPSLTRLDWDGNCPFGLKSFVFVSRDQGRTWPEVHDVFDMWADNIVTWEQKQCVLSDGRLLAITWAFDDESKENLPNQYALSDDLGASCKMVILSRFACCPSR